VQEVVDVPRLVADHQVVVLLRDEVVEHHEVGDHHLVHVPDRGKGIQVVLTGAPLEVPGLVGQRGRGGMHSLALAFQEAHDRLLGEPVHLDVRAQFSELPDDRQVASGVPEADR
jgi:hypothetical protein